MKCFAALAVVALAVSASSQTARADDAAYVVAYAEAQPAQKNAARAALQQYREASAKENGAVRVEILQNIYRPQQFAVIEVWKDDKAREAHASGPVAKKLHDTLAPLQAAPYDERPHGGLAVSPFKGATGIYAVTHVDFVGAKKDEGIAALKTLAAASVKDKGNVRYDVLQQGNRPNHLTLVEVWHNVPALEAHEVAAHTRKFRDDALPMCGALYDQRLYKAIN
jgi:quinol monooxygenase YgiN